MSLVSDSIWIFPGMPLTTVYVRLLDEGTPVWRPVLAEPVGSNCYRLRGPKPEHESWEFAPGEVVRCEHRLFQAGETALSAVAKARTPA